MPIPENVTVDDALRRGRKMVVIPQRVFYIILPFLALIMLGFAPGHLLEKGLIMALITFFVPPLYWCIMVTRWKLWAFDKVRNVHELEDRAIIYGILSKKGGFFEKLEIRTPGQQRKLKMLQDKFNQPDIFVDAPSIPEETSIYYDRKRELIIMALFTILFLAVIILGIMSPIHVPCFGVSVVPLFFIIKHYLIFKDRDVQLLLNAEGIQMAGVRFYMWDVVSDIGINSYGVPPTHYLDYKCPAGAWSIEINNLSTNKNDLLKMISEYRSRFNVRNSVD
jgi:hypothetical protein